MIDSNNANNIKISVIVPVYKVEKELPRCAASLMNQTYHNIEVIFVDDGSPDECPSLCDEYAKYDRRIRVIHKENGGLSDARNSGLNEATGDYILFVDSDDYIELDSCERFISIISNNKPDIVVADARQIIGNNVKYLSHSTLVENQLYSNSEYLVKTIKALECYVPVCFNLYKKEFLIENNLFFVKKLLHEDMEIFPRIFLSSRTIMYLDYVFYNYITRSNSIMQSRTNTENYKDVVKIYSSWLHSFSNVIESPLQRTLYGFLSKCYIRTCYDYKVTSKHEISGIDMRFLIHNSLNSKEKLKAIIYSIFPKLYVGIRTHRIIS